MDARMDHRPATEGVGKAPRGNPTHRRQDQWTARVVRALAAASGIGFLLTWTVGVKRTLAEASVKICSFSPTLLAIVSYGLARAALLAERRRYPESDRALDAVFMLGRLEELNEHGTNKAIAWYDQYLAQARPVLCFEASDEG